MIAYRNQLVRTVPPPKPPRADLAWLRLVIEVVAWAAAFFLVGLSWSLVFFR